MNKKSELEKKIEEYRSIQLAKSHLKNLVVRIDNEKAKLEELSDILDKEYEDVRVLEQLSIQGLFQKLLGDHEQQYELEKQEYLHAFLQYKDCKKSIELLVFEYDILQKKTAREEDVFNELNQMINVRALIFDQKHPKIKNELIKISKQTDHQIGYMRELREALIVCHKTQEVIRKMMRLLEQARDKRLWPPPTKYLYEEIKLVNSYIDQAHQQSYYAKQLLHELEDELDDIYAYQSIKRWNKFEAFQHFNDIYYSQLVQDWVFRGKVIDTLTYLNSILFSVNRIVETLKMQVKITERAMNYLKKRNREVILEHLG